MTFLARDCQGMDQHLAGAQLVGVDGKAVELASLKGKVVCLYFATQRCVPEMGL